MGIFMEIINTVIGLFFFEYYINMIDIYIIIIITSLILLIVTLFFREYQFRTLYVDLQQNIEKGTEYRNGSEEYKSGQDKSEEYKSEEYKRQQADKNKRYDELKIKNTLLEQNIPGIFQNVELFNNDKNCISISESMRNDLSYLELSKTKNCNNIFTYDPVNKQIIVKTNESSKCITSLNETDIVLNDCVKTSEKQKFNYYPLFDGKFYSSLYSKCLSYNNDSNIIELDNCRASNNISNKQGNLFLPNQ